jgi:hypothetical protein
MLSVDFRRHFDLHAPLGVNIRSVENVMLPHRVQTAAAAADQMTARDWAASRCLPLSMM